MTVIQPETPDPGSGRRIKLTLTEFLLARYAEEEDMANTFARYLPSDAEPQFPLTIRAGNTTTIQYLVPWTPGKALADVEAHRQIVNLADFADEDGAWPVYMLVLRFLALPYAGHPDFREEWRP